jgi:penicillin-binding protein 2
VNLRCITCFLWLVAAVSPVLAQSETATPSAAPTPFEETIVPTFETQKMARTYVLDIPAPRGLITDRNGVPLAQNRLSFNLAITFPTPLDFSDPQLLAYAREKIQAAEK